MKVSSHGKSCLKVQVDTDPDHIKRPLVHQPHESHPLCFLCHLQLCRTLPLSRLRLCCLQHLPAVPTTTQHNPPRAGAGSMAVSRRAAVPRNYTHHGNANLPRGLQTAAPSARIASSQTSSFSGNSTMFCRPCCLVLLQ